MPRLALRTALALTILFVAKSLPFLAYVMALVGSFMTISVSITFPALCQLQIQKGQLSGKRVGESGGGKKALCFREEESLP